MWLAAAAALSFAALTLTVRVPEALPDAVTCSSGARSLSQLGDRVYPDQGNGGYTSLHTDLHIVYDTATNLFLPGNHADLTIRSTQCLTDFSFDFERTRDLRLGRGAEHDGQSVTIDGAAGDVRFKQPTYPGNPNGPDDPDPLAHAISNVNPVSATNPNPPACSPQVSGTTQNGAAMPGEQAGHHAGEPDRRRHDDHRHGDYTGRPGVHSDGDGSTEGWFRVNTTAAPNDGGFVTTEPVGNMAWMPLNNHPDRQAHLRRLRHGPGRQDRDRAGRARRA